MVFSSVTFLFYFLPVFFLLYYLLPFRNATLLLASLVFYAWGELDNLWILLVSIAGNYTSGLAISVAQSHGEKGGRALAAGIVINLSVLAYFKYFNLLIATLDGLRPVARVALPHTLSMSRCLWGFHSLHSMRCRIWLTCIAEKPQWSAACLDWRCTSPCSRN